MKAIFTCFSLLIFLGHAYGQGKIVVSITNLVNSKGACKTCLYDKASAFAGNGSAIKCVDVPIKNKTASIAFDAVPKGIYAIAVFHDENGNNKMDKNILGIPKEGYGASKNKLPFASAPLFKDNQFELKEEQTIHLEIRLRNL
jgi:uncharacterized protein (DUF2141 family)